MEVISDILAGALNECNKTRIMYRANLNFLRFDRYVSELLEKGLITEVSGPKGCFTYKTTDKGKALLHVLKDVEKFISLCLCFGLCFRIGCCLLFCLGYV